MVNYVQKNAWHTRLKVAVGQINPTVGDFPGNSEKILAAIDEAQRLSCNLVVFPEMSLTGGPAQDLLLRSDFVKSQISAMRELARRVGKIVAIVGFADRRVEGHDEKLYNSAALIFDGGIRKVVNKTGAQTQSVFSDGRYFTLGEPSTPLKVNGVPLGILVGDDSLRPDACKALVDAGASLIIAPTLMPFCTGEFNDRLSKTADVARKANVDILAVNPVGGQDELIFDGGSFAVDLLGKVSWQAPQFKEGLFVAEVSQARQESLRLSDVEQVRQGLCVATRDFVLKSGFSQVVVGLSGGIDSALVAALAAESLGPENVLGLIMPSDVSPPESAEDAQKLASNLGIETKVIPIKPLFEAYTTTLSEHFGGKAPDVTEENLQARIRGNLLMGFANKLGYMVLSTGNRSESFVGYTTLYGDMVGGFAPISDVPKLLVYELAEHINSDAGREVIPKSTIEKEPSAELRPNQTDAEVLGPYRSLDPILKAYIDEDKAFEEVLESDPDDGAVRKAISRFLKSEFKRYQAPPGPRIMSRVQAKERKMPLVKSIESWYDRKVLET